MGNYAASTIRSWDLAQLLQKRVGELSPTPFFIGSADKKLALIIDCYSLSYLAIHQ
jgi:hypothetical protein